MADTTHNLKIKATLDASGIQSELDRLNQMDRAGRQGGQGSAAGTARILTKLDQTLNRLNRTLESMARGFQGPPGRGGAPGSYQAPPVALSPEAYRRTSSSTPEPVKLQDLFGNYRQMYNGRMNPFPPGTQNWKVVDDIRLAMNQVHLANSDYPSLQDIRRRQREEQQERVRRYQERIRNSTGGGGGGGGSGGGGGGGGAPIVPGPGGGGGGGGRGQGISGSPAARGMALFFASMMSHQAAQLFPEDNPMAVGLNTVGGALAGASTGLMFGPGGAAVGAATGALMELATAAKKATDAMEARYKMSGDTNVWARQQERQYAAEFGGIDAAREAAETAREELPGQRSRRMQRVAELIELTSKPITSKEDA